MRRLWRRLFWREVWLRSDYFEQRIRIKRLDRWTRPGYWFQTQVYKPEWGEWREVGVFPEEIRDDKGRLVTLRIHGPELAHPGDGSVFYIDDSRLTEKP